MATVLVVDDDPTNRALARAVLERGYEIVEASSADEALRVLASHPVDLVLLDVMMPGRSGLDACVDIKRSYDQPFLPVILLTALGEPADRVAGLAAGADDFLSKPFDARELRLRVAAFLRVREQDRASRDELRALHELDAMKDDLTSLLIHDLRNPLAAMLAVLEAAGDSPRPDDVDTLVRATERMRALLDDMLTVRQLEEGVMQANRRAVRVDELLRDAVATSLPVAALRGVRLQVEAPPLEAALDRSLVQRAVENLVSNALKFSPREGLVEVSATVHQGEVELRVADRGPGVPGDVRSRLFEKFGTPCPRFQGGRRSFGLGLYLVRLVAGAHGGEVVAEDRLGGGTVCTLRLPRGGT